MRTLELAKKAVERLAETAVTQKQFDAWKPQQQKQWLKDHPTSKFGKKEAPKAGKPIKQADMKKATNKINYTTLNLDKLKGTKKSGFSGMLHVEKNKQKVEEKDIRKWKKAIIAEHPNAKFFERTVETVGGPVKQTYAIDYQGSPFEHGAYNHRTNVGSYFIPLEVHYDIDGSYVQTKHKGKIIHTYKDGYKPK